jgi:hypothetical protein
VHYRQVPVPIEAVLAQCSRCDQTFEVDPTRAPYRLVPLAHAAAPTFAPRPFFDPPPAPFAEEAAPAADPFTAPEMADAAGAADPFGATLPAPDGAVAEAPAREGSRVSGYGIALGLLLGGVCTASGYYLSLLGITSAVTGTAIGGGAGLILALAVIRWTMRSR